MSSRIKAVVNYNKRLELRKKTLRIMLLFLLATFVYEEISTLLRPTTISIVNPVYADMVSTTVSSVNKLDESTQREERGENVETQTPQVEDMIKEISDRYGVDWKMVYAVCMTESHCSIPKCDSVQGTCDNGRSMGYYQINKDAHPEITEQQANDLAWSTEWTIKHGLKYANNKELFFKNHNGIGKTTNQWYVDNCLDKYNKIDVQLAYN